MMVTATKVKALKYHTLLLPLLIHTKGLVPLPSILHHYRGGYPPLGPTAPPPWRDAQSQRPGEGPCPHITPHRLTRLDSP